jgi:hypothetical protein
MQYVIDGVSVTSNEDLAEELAMAYIERARAARTDQPVESIELTFDGDFVDVHTTYCTEPFERIRRITGYLVGTLDRFNDGKRAEEAERVKHSVAAA